MIFQLCGWSFSWNVNLRHKWSHHHSYHIQQRLECAGCVCEHDTGHKTTKCLHEDFLSICLSWIFYCRKWGPKSRKRWRGWRTQISPPSCCTSACPHASTVNITSGLNVTKIRVNFEQTTGMTHFPSLKLDTKLSRNCRLRHTEWKLRPRSFREAVTLITSICLPASWLRILGEVFNLLNAALFTQSGPFIDYFNPARLAYITASGNQLMTDTDRYI